MPSGEMPSGENASNETEKVFEGDWSKFRNVQIAEENLERLLERGGSEEEMSECIYKMLVTRNGFAVNREKVNSSLKMMKPFEEQSVWYDDEVAEIERNINKGGKFECDDNLDWFGINTRPGVEEKEDNNIKIYVTILASEYSFVQHIPFLAYALKEIADEMDDNINVKFPKNLAVFLLHNDSIVIHFKDRDNIEKIQSALSQWMSECEITEAPRELGRTKVAADSNKKSFIQITSDNIAGWLAENSGKYDNKTPTKLAVKYAIEQSQKSLVE